MAGPILATDTYTDDGTRVRLTVYGGLHMIRGNHAPYFSLTCTSEEYRNGRWHDASGGADHTLILSRFPRFADLAALHLSDIDGVPMHAEANGWYQLAGAMGGAGERYHAGNASYRDTSPAACLSAFARHCRITTDEAEVIRRACLEAAGPALHSPLPIEREAADWKAARAECGRRMADMRPRWKAEAEAVIAAHGLTVYGDPWKAAD